MMVEIVGFYRGIGFCGLNEPDCSVSVAGMQTHSKAGSDLDQQDEG